MVVRSTAGPLGRRTGPDSSQRGSLARVESRWQAFRHGKPRAPARRRLRPRPGVRLPGAAGRPPGDAEVVPPGTRAAQRRRRPGLRERLAPGRRAGRAGLRRRHRRARAGLPAPHRRVGERLPPRTRPPLRGRPRGRARRGHARQHRAARPHRRAAGPRSWSPPSSGGSASCWAPATTTPCGRTCDRDRAPVRRRRPRTAPAADLCPAGTGGRGRVRGAARRPRGQRLGAQQAAAHAGGGGLPRAAQARRPRPGADLGGPDPAGRQAFTGHVAALQQLVQGVGAPPAG